MAIEAAKWAGALTTLGFTVTTVAGEGPVDITVPGLGIGTAAPEDRPALESALHSALAGVDLVVVENLCSLPLNPPAWDAAAAVLAGRPAVLHHHDLPWQRAQFAGHGPPPDDPAWRHVTINERSRRELADRGITATTVYNAFAVPPADPAGRLPRRSEAGWALRRALGVDDDERLVLQPTRALARKGVDRGMAAAARLGATYWLLGPAEDGFGPELDRLVAAAPCPVLLGLPAGATGRADRVPSIDDAYDACDVVALPSTWEGFGNPSVESATHRRPLLIGPYPVADELIAAGFTWFPVDEPAALDRLDTWLDAPEAALLEENLAVARARFSLTDLPGRIAAVLPPI